MQIIYEQIGSSHLIFHARLGIIAKQLNTEGYSSGRRGVTRKRVTILEASPENVLIFQGFRGIMQRKSSRFSLLLFSPFSLMFWEHQKHNLIRRCIEVVITALTRNQVVSQEARGFESHPVRCVRRSLLRSASPVCVRAGKAPHSLAPSSFPKRRSHGGPPFWCKRGILSSL